MAAVAMLIKLEYGAACYCTYALLAAARAWRQRSGKTLATDAAACVPGVLACAAVAVWMVSIEGFEFITQENLASTWPGSFFMTTYGRAWMETTGMAITGPALLQSLARTLFLTGVIVEAYLLFWRKRFSPRSIALCLALFAGLLAYVVFALQGEILETAAALFFPQDMVLYVGIAALLVCWRITRGDESSAALPVAVLLAFAALMAIRTLLRTMATGYSIYFNGPAALAFLILLRPIVPRLGRPRRSVFRAELLLCLGALAVSGLVCCAVRRRRCRSSAARHRTRRHPGVNPSHGAISRGYSTHETGIRRWPHGPFRPREDTSLYFLSSTQAPSRLYFFAPGMLVPGKMTEETIREIEQKPVRYVLWSNRTFPEYGVPEFGVDFERTFANYLTSHYRRVGPLVPGSAVEWHVRFTVLGAERQSAAGMLHNNRCFGIYAEREPTRARACTNSNALGWVQTS